MWWSCDFQLKHSICNGEPLSVMCILISCLSCGFSSCSWLDSWNLLTRNLSLSWRKHLKLSVAKPQSLHQPWTRALTKSWRNSQEKENVLWYVNSMCATAWWEICQRVHFSKFISHFMWRKFNWWKFNRQKLLPSCLPAVCGLKFTSIYLQCRQAVDVR